MKLTPTAFTAEEVSAVLLHYDIGKPHSAQPIRAGNPYAPKAIIETDRGMYFLKRRSPGRDDLDTVAFAHEIQLHLRSKGFPLPYIQRTSSNNSTMLQQHNAVYELFEHQPTTPFDGSTDATFEAGRMLALYHKLLCDHRTTRQPPSGTIHANPDVPHTIESRLRKVKSADGEHPAAYLDDLRAAFGGLRTAYTEAHNRALALSVSTWNRQVTHSDWHPSNVLFLNQHVVGIVDFDSARIQQRIVDVANALVQFATWFEKGRNPNEWPAQVDMPLFHAFIRGYDSILMLSELEIKALPALMIEAIASESVLAARRATDIAGLQTYLPWLQMACRKVWWIHENAADLESVALDTSV